MGYYSFSQDETERQRQQEELRKMREETEKSQRLNMSIKERRDKQMKQRLEAAKRRKRERLGLPPDAVLEDEPPQGILLYFGFILITKISFKIQKSKQPCCSTGAEFLIIACSRLPTPFYRTKSERPYLILLQLFEELNVLYTVSN